MPQLAEEGYCEHDHLNCPACDAGPTESYSYQFHSDEQPASWRSPHRTILVGDRNPLIDFFRSGGDPADVEALRDSLNHDGRLQNYLMSDGSTVYLHQPMIGRDLIWMPAPTIGGDEEHAGHVDTFLVH